MNKIVVIGGGAAGMMAAVRAAECGASVHLIEPNEKLGKKLNITGKGRCNVTNDTDLDGLMQNIPCNGRFLYSAFSQWMPRDTMAFFEEQSVPLKVERGNRVFPVSDSAFDISDALKKRLRHLKVEWVHDRAVEILTSGGAVCAVRGEKETYPCGAAIIATGGVSYPLTGSTGDGYRMAQELGHTIIEPKGSLVPLVSGDEDCAAMQGLSLKNVELTAYNAKNKAVYREFGEMLFTHFGVSGPLVLSLSAHLRNWDKESYRLSIDLKPALDEQKLDARILRDIAESPNKDFEKIVAGLVHRSMVPVVLKRLAIPGTLKANSVTKEQRRALVQLLKHFEVPVSGPRGVAEAIVTSGGVKVSEIEPQTMASKRIEGLYFAGEVIDVDAYTGGFNLQIAWATGRLAGQSAAERDKEYNMAGKKVYSVAVDGPSGAGKSTLSKAIAQELGIVYVDTGAIYRTIGLYVQRKGIAPKDPTAVAAILPEIQIDMKHGEDGLQHMYLLGEDVTTQIRLPEISMYASDVSAIPAVRDFLMEMQRSIARKQSVIMDGRDIGTVVLPDADVKIFLYADLDVRAKRRCKELEERGTPKPFEVVRKEMEERDYQDTHREIAPLQPAVDSIMVDTSDMGFFYARNLLIDMIEGSVGL